MGTHSFQLTLSWTGNRGHGTADPQAYGRDHEVRAGTKPVLLGSADPVFRGDPTRYNPEELLIAALSACHLLSYLYLCAVGGVVVVGYTDEPSGTLVECTDGSGRITEVVLRPRVVVAEDSMADAAARLHDEAHRLCFICASVNFPVRHQATVEAAMV